MSRHYATDTKVLYFQFTARNLKLYIKKEIKFKLETTTSNELCRLNFDNVTRTVNLSQFL